MPDPEKSKGFANENDIPGLKAMIDDTLRNLQTALTVRELSFLTRMKNLRRPFTKAEEKEIHLLWQPYKEK